MKIAEIGNGHRAAATRSAIRQLEASGQFDAAWYAARYPDVTALGMDPAEHYLAYGHLMNRDPGPAFSTVFARLAYSVKPGQEPVTRLAALNSRNGGVAPDRKRVLMAANAVARQGDHRRAIALAEAHLPPELAHTTNILRANAALARGDEAGWLGHVNAYLAHFGTAPIRLAGEGSIFDRLSCAPLPPVTGGPLISVIMPAWNAEKTVRKAAQSILDQTWRNLELLIVDDASEDRTWSILQQIAASDSRVRILRNRVNVGPYVSKNFALKQAAGEWITGHDADDWAHPDRMKTHLSATVSVRNKCSLSYMMRAMPSGTLSQASPIGAFSFDGIARVASVSTFFNRSWMRETIGFWDSARFGADSEIISRARTLLGDGFISLEKIGMICLDLPQSLTNDPETGIKTTTGLSSARSEYKSAWSKWHASSDFRRSAFVEFPHIDRRFPAPQRVLVSNNDVNLSLCERTSTETFCSFRRCPDEDTKDN